MKHLLIFIAVLLTSFTALGNGIDSNTLLMAHLNGADASTSIVDSSSSNKTLTPSGSFQIDTAQSKFGTASGLSDGTSDYFTAADSNDFYIGTGSATIDQWVRFNTIQSTMFYTQAAGANSIFWQYYKDTTYSILSFQVYDGGANTVIGSVNWTPTVNTWYHVALVKDASTYRIFVDGTQIGTFSDSSPWPDVASTAYFGARSDGARSLDGWFDEIRFSKTARYTSNFTPETAEYSEPEPIDLGDVKNSYFADMSAMLDSDCQVYVNGTFDITVPTGETWYIFNAWFVHNGDGKMWFHRKIGVNEAMTAPAGTRLKSGNANSFLWYCRPKLVQEGDERYQDAEILWYERLQKIKLEELKSAIVSRASNSTDHNRVTLPNIEKMIITHVSTHGGSWTALYGGNVNVSEQPERASNTLDELNDGHEIRFTGTVIQPIKRSIFDKIHLGLGNRSDAYGVAHTEETFGGIHFVEQPEPF